VSVTSQAGSGLSSIASAASSARTTFTGAASGAYVAQGSGYMWFLTGLGVAGFMVAGGMLVL